MKIYVQTTGGAPVRNFTATIPVGYYGQRLSDFITAVSAALNNADTDVYTVSIDTISGKMTIATDGVNHFRLEYAESTIGNVLGFTVSPAYGYTITGDRPVDLSGITSIMLQSNMIPTRTLRATGTGGSIGTFLADIKISEPFNRTIFYHNTNPLDVITTNRLSSSLSMELRNRNSVLLDNNGFHWRISFLINY